MKNLALGIGNPILGDDGIGFHVAQELAGKVKDESIIINVKDASVDGLNLLKLIAGYDKVVKETIPKVVNLVLQEIGST